MRRWCARALALGGTRRLCAQYLINVQFPTFRTMDGYLGCDCWCMYGGGCVYVCVFILFQPPAVAPVLNYNNNNNGQAALNGRGYRTVSNCAKERDSADEKKK